MLRTRFPFACSVVALAFSAMPAHAQSAPAPAAPALNVLTARINDIQVARTGDTISILVKLSQQPAAAKVKSSGETLTLEIDGLQLNALKLTPPAGSLVTRVEAASGKLMLSGVAFSSPKTVIYRNAVMIEAKLAEPALPAATSLMGATIVAPKPAASAPIERAPVKAVETPAVPAPIPVALTPAPQPKLETPDELQSHPAPPQPVAAASHTASMAGVDAARCSTAAKELAEDAWALAAMGDHALCLIDAGKLDEAKNRLDQLGAITPRDWRVALGRAALAETAGDMETAKAGFESAALAAPNDAVRAAIAARIPAAPAVAAVDNADIQLPLPSATLH